MIDGRWKKLDDGDLGHLHTDYWVDICHGANALDDERYYFDSLADAQEFYLTGWKERQYLNDDDQPVGLEHAGLYSRGRLIDGRSFMGMLQTMKVRDRRKCSMITPSFSRRTRNCEWGQCEEVTRGIALLSPPVAYPHEAGPSPRWWMRDPQCSECGGRGGRMGAPPAVSGAAGWGAHA
jgi:hypothetical protein